MASPAMHPERAAIAWECFACGLSGGGSDGGRGGCSGGGRGGDRGGGRGHSRKGGWKCKHGAFASYGRDAREQQQQQQQQQRQQKQQQPCEHALLALQAAAGGTAPGVVRIDGSAGEGGGQVLRVSAALAAITRTPLVVTGVRAKRSRPGLRPQHLEGLRLIARACGAALAGGEVGSTALALLPGDAQAAVDRRRELVADTGTAGSVTMLAQAVLPVLLYADAPAREGESEGEGIELRARLVGGTDAAMAPPVDYMRRVLLPTLQDRFGVRARAELRRRGFYPRGGGTLVLHVAPLARGAAMPPLRTRGAGAPPAPVGFEVFAFDAGAASGKGFADTAHAAATTELKKLVGEDYCVDGHVDAADAASDGVLGGGGGVSVVMRIAGAGHESFGAAGAAEVIDLKSGDPKAAGEQAARRAAAVVRSLGGKGAFADADEHLQDQLVIFMALAEGKSELLCVGEGADGDERGGQLTLHTRTAMDVCKQMLPTCSFEVEALDGGGWKVVCTGAGVRKA